ncbi:MAG: AraC family transcriptional regulator [Muribaculaceae bacterium]|nr:AraC family transcriptional regulator [Muribaculaceae bacterium]
MDLELKYSVKLPENVADILDSDFWVYTGFDAAIISTVSGPVKFSASVSVYVSSGSGELEINLRKYRIQAPCVVNIRAGEILQAVKCTPDLRASCMVMSRKFIRSIFMAVNDIRTLNYIFTSPIRQIPPEMTQQYDDMYTLLYRTYRDFDNPYRYNAMLFSVLSFYYHVVGRTYCPSARDWSDTAGRLSDRFLALVEEHFREERFLDFYAAALAVTPKHLSRTIKAQTGQSAAEWIERFVILEAKVLLKSSTLNVQQISELLHFPTQSFFGKYFKKRTGLSPKEFRNS